MKKNLIMTFDYELFLGEITGTVNNSVIKPVQLILEVLRQNNAKAIFFVDTTWLLFLKKHFPDDLKTVSKQLREIVRQGSSVELHLHPQWINAYSKGDSVVFGSFENYKLHSFPQDEILHLFRQSIDLLESITWQKITCFRAGGFCIEPFGKLKEAFETFNLKYDFSVAPGVYLRSGNLFDFDFSGAPQLLHYSFKDSVLTPDIQGDFTEIPLSTYNNNPLYRMVNMVLLKLKKDKIMGDGSGIQQELTLFSRLLSKRMGFSRTFLTLDQLSPLVFKHIFRFHFRTTPLMVIISHPKTMSNQALRNLTFVSKTCNTFNASDLETIFSHRKIRETSPVL